MKTEEEIRERMDKIMQLLKKVKNDDTKLFTLSAALRELDWVLR